MIYKFLNIQTKYQFTNSNVLQNRVNIIIRDGFGPDIDPYSATFIKDIKELEELYTINKKKFSKTVIELDNGKFYYMINLFFFFAIKENKLV